MDNILLTKDISLIIVSHLHIKDICSYIRTSPALNKLLDCNQLWSMLCKRYDYTAFQWLPCEEQYRTCFKLTNFMQKREGYWSLGYLSNTTKLEIHFDGALDALPQEIGNMTKLQEILLGSNQLSSLPASFINLTNLQELSLRDNKFQSLPLVLTDLHNLQKLNLESNQLIMLPQEIGKLTKLQELSLRNNKLSVLPHSIGELINLRYIDLRDNFLESLPQEISKLECLTGLWVEGNCIHSFPCYLSNLPVNESICNF